MRYILIVFACSILTATYGQKQKNTEYNIHRAITIEAMDSLLKNAKEVPDILMKFADKKCKEFHNDTLLMSRIAESFAIYGGHLAFSQQRFRELKRVHPRYLSGYFNYANVMHSYGTKVTPEGGLQRQPEYRDLAKAQIDSAKTASPNSIQPYLAWIGICAPFAFSEAVVHDMDKEVEALNKVFPQANAYYKAAQVLRNATPAVQDIEDAKLRADYEFLIDRKALDYYEKIKPETMTAVELYDLSTFYYTSTRSPYLDRQDKQQLYERGAELARLGTQKFPDSIGFQRMLLWHNAELAKSDESQRISYSQEAHEAAEQLFASSKGKPIAVDYFYDALSLQNTGKYEAAISKYRDALRNGLVYSDRNYHRDSVTTMDNLSDCYKAKEDYESAIAEKKQLFRVRQAHQGELRLSDMQSLTSLYRSIANDTLKSAKERLAAFVSCDSIYGIIQAEIDANNTNYDLPEGWTGYGIYNRFQMRLGMDQIQANRPNLSTFEMAKAYVDRVERLEAKSEREQQWLIATAINCVSYYNQQEDYGQCVKYANIVFKYDPSYQEKWKSLYKKWKSQTRRV